MAHLFGLIALRTGISRALPLFGELNTQVSPLVVNESLPAPLSVVAVVTALQSELHHRRVSSLVTPPLRRLPFKSVASPTREKVFGGAATGEGQRRMTEVQDSELGPIGCFSGHSCYHRKVEAECVSATASGLPHITVSLQTDIG